MTTTDELRRLLDERGAEHEDSELIYHDNGSTTYYTEWGGNDGGNGVNVYVEYTDGTVLRMFDATPEQALTATLGSHEWTTKMYRDEHGIWHCAACERGADVITGNDGELDMWNDSWAPNYCPYCGRRGEQ